MNAASPVMEVSVSVNLWFTSLGETQGEYLGFPVGLLLLLTEVLFDRATEAPPSQHQKRGPEPYRNKNDNTTGPRVPRKQRDKMACLPPAPRRPRAGDEILVDVIFSAHSDGLIAILRKT